MAGIFPQSRRGSNREAGDFDSKARAIARYVVAEMQNEGIGMSFEEAKALARVENSDASEFRCANPECRSPISDPAAKACPRCGSKTMIVSSGSAYRCQRCGSPVDLSDVRCGNCGHDKAVRASVKSNPAPYYTCTSCLRTVSLSQPSCSCGNRKAYKTFER